jgi:hypothetical protein
MIDELDNFLTGESRGKEFGKFLLSAKFEKGGE